MHLRFALSLNFALKISNLTKLNLGKNDWSLGFNAGNLLEKLPSINLKKGGGIPEFPNAAAWASNLKTIHLQGNNFIYIPPEHIQNMNITWFNIRMNWLVSVAEHKT